MEPMNMSEGMHLDEQMMIQVLTSKLADAAIQGAKLEAAVQQLLMEKQALLSRLDALEASEEVQEEG